ncbi:carboxypeptidase-like regulatory domain-containing protein [Hymenobacter sp. IS2118]|uniref:carboxypeptidase-like regulatory domain-containing protein n=1 Tax=Hymenobacter sp. IS2118 TaxID=1505605 RepID=UPI0005509C55|nr:carboxypeptidase-like regulatory domain-containing protein [Hymenobacter sp. IS2118]
MRFYPVLLLFIALILPPASAFAQASISGVAQDSVTRQPLAFASVFLANTTLGVTTTEQGKFVFPSVPAGTYDVVGSYVGYRLAKQTVTVAAVPQQITLRLGPSANRLGEVVVRADPNRQSNYRVFVDLFLGRTSFSQQCTIKNPDEVVVDFDTPKNTLTASSANFLQVDNKALGYRIKYFGLRFSCDFTARVLQFYGEPVFEEMAARSKGQQRRWEENREKAYRGSLTHFLKSVRDDQVSANGFLAQRLRVVPNPRFARIDSLRQRLLRARGLGSEISPAEIDSLNRWRDEPRQFSMLYTAPRPIDSLCRKSDDGSQTFLRFRDFVQVTYIREAPDPLYRRSLSPLATAKSDANQVSQLLLRVPETEIKPNGHLANPLAVFADEYWGFEKMGEFLPLNYLPPAAVPGP